VNTPPEEGADPVNSARSVTAKVMQLIATRVELFALEFEEERRSVVGALLLLALAVIGGALALVLILFGAILALPPEWRAAGAGGAGVAIAAATLGIVVHLRRRLRDRPPPFSSTVAELKRDSEWIQKIG
jgi:uncharacterized membrane protein YqjE